MFAFCDEQGLALQYYCTINDTPSKDHSVYVQVDSNYARDLVLSAFTCCHVSSVFWSIDSETQNAEFVWDEYENIDWSKVLSGKQIANSYCVRKGLSRKAQLSMYLQKYMEKRPKSSVVLQKSLPKTHVIDTWEAFQTDDGIRMTFSERLDSCLWEIKSLMESKHGNRWILKPSATNKGAEVNVVENYAALRQVIYTWTDIREWVLQKYIEKPMVYQNKKFHVRVYVLAVGCLQVYVFQKMLVLCATEDYYNGDDSVQDCSNSFAHLTNTFHQQNHKHFDANTCVFELQQLVKDMGQNAVDAIQRGINDIVPHIFEAYRGEFSVFQPLPNCFELYGLDFMVNDEGQVFFLEVNPGPDFQQTGMELRDVISSLMQSTVDVVTNHFYHDDKDPCLGDFTKVYDQNWGFQSKNSNVNIKFL